MSAEYMATCSTIWSDIVGGILIESRVFQQSHAVQLLGVNTCAIVYSTNPTTRQCTKHIAATSQFLRDQVELCLIALKRFPMLDMLLMF